jgi:ABC-type multidrug transport system fused ATPase/permease subunit
MIQILKYGQVENEKIFARVEPAVNVEAIVADIIENVKNQGDAALFAYTEKFDKAKLSSLAVTQEEIEEACRAASVHDFMTSLPSGYDTMVGELGDTLSGGERQRLGLARAFLHDAPFLLLDEPTSNLDSLNEGAILASLDAQRGKRTVLLVSHRSSTMAIADKTVSMESGRVS